MTAEYQCIKCGNPLDVFIYATRDPDVGAYAARCFKCNYGVMGFNRMSDTSDEDARMMVCYRYNEDMRKKIEGEGEERAEDVCTNCMGKLIVKVRFIDEGGKMYVYCPNCAQMTNYRWIHSMQPLKEGKRDACAEFNKTMRCNLDSHIPQEEWIKTYPADEEWDDMVDI